MIFTYKNYKFTLTARPNKEGYFACYRCECGENHCSSHSDSTKERALQVAEGNAISHYNRTHELKITKRFTGLQGASVFSSVKIYFI